MKAQRQHHLRAFVLGVPVDAVTVDQLHAYILEATEAGDRRLILNANVHCVNLAWKNSWLRELMNRADLVFCDGEGVRLGARVLGFDLPARITYAQWMWQLAEFAEANELSLYFVGGRPGIAAMAAERLLQRFPKLTIAGIDHGYFSKTLHHPENEAVVSRINAAQPHILIVGLGMPLQERWLAENWGHLEANIGLTGGAVFDYVSGTLRRPPPILTANGLEWFGRFIIEPHRLWRRYLIGNPLFALRIVGARLRRRRQSP